MVFKPVGLLNIVVKDPLHQAAHLYSYPYEGSQGFTTGDFTGTVGAVGWYLTATETGKLFARVLSSSDQSVLSTALKATLLGDRLGCLAGLSKDQMVVYYHDGWQWEPDSSDPGSYRGLRTVWMKYPEDMTIVVFVNALNPNRLFPFNTGLDVVDYVDQAYSRASQIQNGRVGYFPLQLEHTEYH